MDEESNSLTENLLGEQQKDDTPIAALINPSSEENIDTNIQMSQTEIPVTEGSDLISPSDWERGEVQPSKYQDVSYAIVFLSHLVLMVGYSVVQYIQMTDNADDRASSNNGKDANQSIFAVFFTKQLIPVIIAPIIFASIFISISFIILTKMGEAFISLSVWTSVVLSIIAAVCAFDMGNFILGAMCMLGAAFGTCYAIAVRSRIPFAAANLAAGVTAVQSNLGVFLVPCISTLFVFFYLVLWSFSLTVLSGVTQVCPDSGDSCTLEVSNPGWIYPWIFCLFWTIQIVKYVSHCIVAGVAATWYFDPAQASSFCSNAISGSAKRSLTYSFGSICLGSLLVAIVQFLDFIVRSIRQNVAESRERSGFEALLLCCADCILQMVENLMQYFNKWAFIYVAVYGYPYLTAGHKVMTLFERRGWTVIINDNLVSNALGLMSFSVALLCGMGSAIVAFFFVDSGDRSAQMIVFFWSSFGIGLMLALTAMSIVDSSVSTIILCFAEAPQEFELKHETQSRKVREAWTKVYPMIRF